MNKDGLFGRLCGSERMISGPWRVLGPIINSNDEVCTGLRPTCREGAIVLGAVKGKSLGDGPAIQRSAAGSTSLSVLAPSDRDTGTDLKANRDRMSHRKCGLVVQTSVAPLRPPPAWPRRRRPRASRCGAPRLRRRRRGPRGRAPGASRPRQGRCPPPAPPPRRAR